jgi:rhodanese-related sulfurtransferase
MFGLFNTTKNYENLSGRQFETLRKDDSDTVVLDVRTDAEFSSGHIPGAINLDIMAGEFQNRIASLEPEKKYLVYCRSGSRSQQACSLLGAKGLKSFNLSGGIISWQGPVEI